LINFLFWKNNPPIPIPTEYPSLPQPNQAGVNFLQRFVIYLKNLKEKIRYNEIMTVLIAFII